MIDGNVCLVLMFVFFKMFGLLMLESFSSCGELIVLVVSMSLLEMVMLVGLLVIFRFSLLVWFCLSWIVFICVFVIIFRLGWLCVGCKKFCVVF